MFFIKKTIINYLIIFAIIFGIIFCARYIFSQHSGENRISIPNLITTQQSHTELEKVEVDHVVDGDTIYIKNSAGDRMKVRFIGCNTPESVASDSARNCEEGKDASAHTKQVLYKGRTIYLQYDIQKKDKYNRTLAYVWLSNKVDVNNESDIRKYLYNAQLIIDGYAETMFVSPNYLYQQFFNKFQNEAIKNNCGYWEQGEFDKH